MDVHEELHNAILETDKQMCRVTELEQENAELTAKVTELESELAKLTDAEALKAELTELLEKCDAHTGPLEKHPMVIRLRNQNAQLETRLGEAEEARDTAMEARDSALEARESAIATRDATMEEVAQLTQARDTAITQWESCKASAIPHAERIAELEKDLAGAVKMRDSYNAELQSRSALLDERVAEVDTLTADRERQAGVLKTNLVSINELTAKVRELESELKASEKEKARQEGIARLVRAENTTLRKQRDAANADIVSGTKTEEQLHDALAAMRAQWNIAVRAATAYQQDIELLKATVADLTTERDEARQDLHETQCEVDELQKQRNATGTDENAC